MNRFTSVNDPEVARLLRAGGIGVIRTDTLYGVVAAASNEAAVRRVYELKGRDGDKSPIVLISSTEQLYDTPDAPTQTYLNATWPGPVSVIIPSVNAPGWIARGNQSVAYRMPDNQPLRDLLALAGPLIAPSANPQGAAPAMSVDEAEQYFGTEVDFYVDGGVVQNPEPSMLMRIGGGEVTRLR